MDDDSTPESLIFNKTVGLRDSWERQKPKTNNQETLAKVHRTEQKRPAISVLQQLGKKYTNLPEDKQNRAKDEIIALVSRNYLCRFGTVVCNCS